VTKEFDLHLGDLGDLGDGKVLHAYDTGPSDGLAVLWHHGTPNKGAPPKPLFEAAARLGIRWISYDRPGYGGSTPDRGRTIGSAAAYAARVADALGIERFAVMGYSGGGSHAIACGALLPERVLGVVSLAGLAPYGADGLDWFAGMVDSGLASLRAARAGLAAKEAYEASGVEYDPEFTRADMLALTGDWSWLGEVAGPAARAEAGGLVDDDIAYVTPWGCDPGSCVAPTLLVHGDADRVIPGSHSKWLARRCPDSQLWLTPGDGHISVLNSAGPALDWLRR